MRDIWVVSRFAITSEAAVTIHEPVILFLHLGVDLLGHGGTVAFTLDSTTTRFSKLVWPFYLPTSNEYEFWLLNILVSIGYCQFFLVLAIFMHV